VLLIPINEMKLKVPVVSWVCLLLFSIYGIVITHDYSAELTARARAAKQAEHSGIPANHISAGFERDGWFQSGQPGRIVPSMYGQPIRIDSTHFWFWFHSWAIQPDYVAISSYGNEVPRNAILEVPFTAWSLPHKRTISIVKREDIPKG
jgi:hypothetical protein